MNDNIIIVTRHDGMVEWLRRKGITGDVLERATKADVEGMQVYGKLPMYLAALTEIYTTVSIPKVFGRLEQSERDLTADEMNEMGAYLESYIIHEVARV